MIFTWAARIVAILLFVLGAAGIALGFSVGSGFIEEAEVVRYLGPKTTGEAIDSGVFYLFLGICLGLVTDISRSLVRLTDSVSAL